MVIIALVVVFAAVGLAAHWAIRPYNGFGRERSFPIISVGLLGAVAVAAVIPTYLRTNEERRLSAVASKIVGAPVKVHCETFGQTFTEDGPELGFVRWGPNGVPEHQTFIKRAPCKALSEYLSSNKEHPTADEIEAVHVLTHESMHMRGQKNEADAECEAMQRDATTAELLGATPAQAIALARIYWFTDYPLMPANYRSADCAPGGSLDEHLPNAPWNPASAG